MTSRLRKNLNRYLERFNGESLPINPAYEELLERIVSGAQFEQPATMHIISPNVEEAGAHAKAQAEYLLAHFYRNALTMNPTGLAAEIEGLLNQEDEGDDVTVEDVSSLLEALRQCRVMAPVRKAERALEEHRPQDAQDAFMELRAGNDSAATSYVMDKIIKYHEHNKPPRKKRPTSIYESG